MKTKIVELTPELADKYLEKNTANRDVSQDRVNEYAYALEHGHWKPNGASLVIDRNGIVRDGQHRLLAVQKSRVSIPIVLVTDVEPDVMATIDIGKARALHDILKLNGFKYSTHLAAIIKRIVAYDRTGAINRPGESATKVTNSIGLDYAIRHQEDLSRLIREAHSIYNASPTNTISSTHIAFFMYVLDGFNVSEDIKIFMRSLTGMNTYDNSAASWLYGKLYRAKAQKITLNSKWVLGMVIKAWNSFQSGDPQVTSMRYDVRDSLPAVL